MYSLLSRCALADFTDSDAAGGNIEASLKGTKASWLVDGVMTA
jgi:hypothetical protein